jgi:hypothetical protein
MKETTSIMLWMLLFLLLITFWVDLRIRGLREEFMQNISLLERCLNRQVPHENEGPFTTDAQPPSVDGNLAPWTAKNAQSSVLPTFIDDLVPSKEELSKAVRGVDYLMPEVRPSGNMHSGFLSGYEGSAFAQFAPYLPPSVTHGA